MTDERRGVHGVAVAIIESETAEDEDEGQQLEAAERILAALQDELVRLVGATGFHALLDRSFHRAAARQGYTVHARPPSPATDYLRNFRDNMHSIPLTDTYGAMVAVLTELLSLLTRLIGADIVAGLVQRTWPGVAPWLQAEHLEDVDG